MKEKLVIQNYLLESSINIKFLKCGYKIDNGYAEDGYFQSRNAEFEP